MLNTAAAIMVMYSNTDSSILLHQRIPMSEKVRRWDPCSAVAAVSASPAGTYLFCLRILLM